MTLISLWRATLWGAAACFAVAQLPSTALAQDLPPVPAVENAAPEALKTAEGATNTAQETAKSATETAQDTAKSATDSAQDAAKSATNTAQDTAKSATNTAQDAAKNATGTAQDAARTATGTAQDAAKSATGTARDATRNATGTAQDATRNATGAARDATRNATGAAQDATRNATDAARDTTRNATDAAKDATRNAQGAARDATRNATGTAQDATRNATGAARDAARTTTDAAQDATRNATDAARDVTRDARDTAQDVREDARDISRDARGAAQDIRSDVRQTTREAVGNTTIRSNQSVTASSQPRAADLGLWFDRSVRDGLVIADVATNATLSSVGFVEGDRIISVMGQPVASEADFLRVITNTQYRERMPVILVRDGVQQTVYIEPTMITSYSSTVQHDPLEQFGIVLDDRYPDRLVIWRVIPRSPAFYAGLRSGDVIRMFAGQQLTEPAQLVEIVQTADPGVVAIQVDRGGRVRQLEADLANVQVSDQRTTFRQDLDADANIRTQPSDNRPTLNVEVNNRDELRTDTALPAAPSSRTVSPAPSYAPRAVPSNSGNYSQPRRGVFRRW